MTSQSNWEALVPRLEADLQARELPQLTSLLDDDAWETAVQLLRSCARVLMFSHSGLRQEDVDDIVQNVLVKLQSTVTMRRLRAAGSAEGYIVVMLRNAANDLVRRSQREKALLSTLGDKSAIEPALEPDYVLQTEEASVLAKALESLTEADRALLKMRFWRNMSIADIATENGMSYSATAVRLFRILHRLRDRMTA